MSAMSLSFIAGLPIIRTWLRIVGNLARKNITLVAGGVAFYAFLAIFPAIACALMVWGFFTDVSDLTEPFKVLRGMVPDPVFDIVSEQMVRIAKRGGPGSPMAALISLALALWSAARAVSALMLAMQSIYSSKVQRGFLSQKLLALAFTLTGIIFAVISLAMIGAVPPIIEALKFGALADAVLLSLRWFIIVALFMAGGAAFYAVTRRDPDRVSDDTRNQIIPGAIAAAIIWLAASFLFSFYLSEFETYNDTFGSLGAVAALLMWLWISAIALLVGAEINADFEGKKARDLNKIVPIDIPKTDTEA